MSFDPTSVFVALFGANLSVDSFEEGGATLEFWLRSQVLESHCPRCGQPTGRIHSHHRRVLRDAPIGGKPVLLHLNLCRFRCRQPTCPQQIFCERVPELAVPSLHRTRRVSSAFVDVASALGGRGGARFGAHLGLQTSASTLLRCIQGFHLPAIGPLRFVGIDDFAFRKGHRYGTVIVDLETHCPVEILPDRTTPVVEAWLRMHPEITLVTRDRSTEFASAITSGLPEATQVLDRWHLLKNLREVLERFLGRHQQVLRDATPDPKPRSTEGEKLRAEIRERQQGVLKQMVELKASGLGTRVIARQLGVSRYLVKRYLQADAVPARRAHTRVRSILDPYLDVLNRRWDEGCQVGAHLLKELKALGSTGTRRPLDAWLRPKRAGTPLPSPAEQQDTLNASRVLLLADVEAAMPLRIAPQELLWLLWNKVEDRQEDEQYIVSTLMDRLPALQGVVSLVHEFMDLMHRKRLCCLRACAQNLRRENIGYAPQESYSL